MTRATADTPVPLLDLGIVHSSIAEELKRDFARVLASGQFILGSEHDAFERELAEVCGVEHAVGLSSGTAAISLALQALGIGPGDEVIVPAFTYFATASAVTQVGAHPIFADIEPVRLGLAAESVEAKLGARTRAILPVHLYGLACDLAPLAALGERSGVPILEDAAQAIGSTDGGKPVGKATAGATLSFFPTKNLGGLGDGGAFLTEREDLAAKMKLLRAQGDAGDYRHTALGTNARLDALQAAFLRTKLRHLSSWTAMRRATAALYRKELALVPVTLPPDPVGAIHTYHQFTIRTPERDRLQSHLRAHGIATRIYYPIILPAQPCFSYLSHRHGEFPASERAAQEVLSLPMYPGMTPEQVERVAGAIRAFYAGNRGASE